MEQAQVETILHPQAIISELKKNNVTHVVWLPDSETNFMYQLLTSEPSLDLVPVCREGETMAIAAGLWVGGKKPVVLIQNTGIFESGDSIRGLGLDVNQPLVMLVGYRGWSRHGSQRRESRKREGAGGRGTRRADRSDALTGRVQPCPLRVSARGPRGLGRVPALRRGVACHLRDVGRRAVPTDSR